MQEETSERKNALEAYIYSLRNKLYDALAPYVTDDAKAALLGRLEEMEVCLFGGGRCWRGQPGPAGSLAGAFWGCLPACSALPTLPGLLQGLTAPRTPGTCHPPALPCPHAALDSHAARLLPPKPRPHRCLLRCAAQNWLYDEGEDEAKSVYVAKLAELRKAGDPIQLR